MASASSNNKYNLDRWAKRVALVTGASRGIGLAISKALVEAGLIVIGVAREIGPVTELSLEYKDKGSVGSLVPMQCDIGDTDSIKELFTNIKADPDLEGVDICINNAAIAYAESFLSGDPKAWRNMMNINFIGAAHITQEAVKSMTERDVTDGHIIFMNSLSGHRIIPGNKDIHVYSATKLAMRSLLEGVRIELRAMDVDIRVSAVSPGVVETDIFKAMFEGDDSKALAFLEERKYLTAQDVTDCVLFILSQPPHVQVHDILVRSTQQIP